MTNIKGIEKFDLVYMTAPRKATYLDMPANKIRFHNVGPLVVKKGIRAKNILTHNIKQ